MGIGSSLWIIGNRHSRSGFGDVLVSDTENIEVEYRFDGTSFIKKAFK